MLILGIVVTIPVNAEGNIFQIEPPKFDNLKQLDEIPLETQESIKTLIDNSNKEILIEVPYLRNKIIAESLREAAAIRGVPVYLLTQEDMLIDPASYTASLSMISKIQVKYLDKIPVSYIIIDRNHLIVTESLSNISGSLTGYNEYEEKNPSINAFLKRWEAGKSFNFANNIGTYQNNLLMKIIEDNYPSLLTPPSSSPNISEQKPKEP